MKFARLLAAFLSLCAPASASSYHAAQTPFTLSPRVLQSGVDPQIHLRKAIATAETGGTVNVCIAGDSTSLNTPAGVHSTEGLWYQIQRAFVGSNPGVKFSFQNFGIPGTTFGAFLSNAQAQAQAYGLAWYASSANWDQFVAAAGCHVLLLNWGVNDAYNISTTTLFGILNYIGQWTLVPDVIFVTNAVANPAAGAPYSSANYQAGYVAGRSLIEALVDVGSSGFSAAWTSSPPPPLGIIDVGRVFGAAVNGKDYLDQTSSNSIGLLPSTTVTTLNSTTPYVFPQTDGDFDLKVTFPGQLAAFTNTTTVNISVGAMDGGTGTVLAEVVLSTGGGYLTFYNDSDVNIQTSKTFSGTDLTIEVAIKGDMMWLTVNGASVSGKYLKPTAPFTPKMSLTGSSPPSSTTFTVQTYATGTARAYNPVLSTADAYGPSVSSASLTNAVAQNGTVLTFSSGVPSAVSVGQPVYDVTTAPAISSTAVVASNTSTTVTLSVGAPLAAGIAALDNISFGSIVSKSGGNGINHDASGALNLVYGTALAATKFCLICGAANRLAVPSRAPAVVATTGGSTTAAQGLISALLNPAGTLATYAYTLPPHPVDGDKFSLVSTQAITALTVNAASGQTITGTANPITLAAFSIRAWTYYVALTTWVETQ